MNTSKTDNQGRDLTHSTLVTLVLASLVTFGPMGTDMLLPALPSMANELGSSDAEIQLTLSAYMLGFGLCQLIYGPLSDQYGRRLFILGGGFLFSVASLAIALSNNTNEIIALRVLQAVGGAAGPVLARAIARDIHGPKGSAKILSQMGALMALAPAIAPFFGALFNQAWGWRSIFIGLALYSLIIQIGYYRQIPETSPRTQSLKLHRLKSNILQLLNDRHWRAYSICGSASFAGFFAFLSTSPFYIQAHFGYSETVYALFFAVVVLGFFTGSIVSAKMSHLGPNKLIYIGTLFMMLSALFMLIGLSLWPFHIASLIIPQMAYACTMGVILPQSNAGEMADHPEMAGTSSSLSGGLRSILAATVGGLAAQCMPFVLSLPLIMLVCSIVALILCHQVLRKATTSE